MKKDLLKGLSEEQIQKASRCENPEELLALAKKEGVELTDEQLEAVSGGCGWFTTLPSCPECGSKWVYEIDEGKRWKCSSCGKKWHK